MAILRIFCKAVPCAPYMTSCPMANAIVLHAIAVHRSHKHVHTHTHARTQMHSLQLVYQFLETIAKFCTYTGIKEHLISFLDNLYTTDSLYSGAPPKGHPSTKDIYVIKDTYRSPKYHVTAIFYPLMRGHLTVKDKKYCPIGVHLIGVPLAVYDRHFLRAHGF